LRMSFSCYLGGNRKNPEADLKLSIRFDGASIRSDSIDRSTDPIRWGFDSIRFDRSIESGAFLLLSGGREGARSIDWHRFHLIDRSAPFWSDWPIGIVLLFWSDRSIGIVLIWSIDWHRFDLIGRSALFCCFDRIDRSASFWSDQSIRTISICTLSFFRSFPVDLCTNPMQTEREREVEREEREFIVVPDSHSRLIPYQDSSCVKLLADRFLSCERGEGIHRCARFPFPIDSVPRFQLRWAAHRSILELRQRRANSSLCPIPAPDRFRSKIPVAPSCSQIDSFACCRVHSPDVSMLRVGNMYVYIMATARNHAIEWMFSYKSQYINTSTNQTDN
jgi:hypothetical protein